LKADPRNPRKMAPEATAGLAISMETFGALDIVFNQRTGELVSGHQRVRSLREAGAAEVTRDGEWGFVTHPQTGERFPVRFVDWDETKQRMGNLVANNPALQGDFTPEALDQARALQEEANFAELGLAKLTADLEAQLKAERDNEPQSGHCDPDDVPEPPADPISKLGDLWILGDHRILCGDSTNTDDVARLMGGERAVLMATDPPYLVNYTGEDHPQSAEREKAGKSNNKNWDAYKDPETSVEFFTSFIRVGLGNALVDVPAIYQWHASRRQALVEAAWTANGLLLHQQIVWVKSRPILTRSHYMWQHEPCFYGWIEGRPPALRPPVCGDCSTVWTIAGEQDGIHPTQKPVEIFERPITYHTRTGDVVYEPFSGSGSQIIAAERLGRRCFAMELEPTFVDVAVKRWENFTHRGAVRSR
ncbi:MAG: DNA modification methylase, partial [Polyangia bacterium]